MGHLAVIPECSLPGTGQNDGPLDTGKVREEDMNVERTSEANPIPGDGDNGDPASQLEEV